VEDDERKEEKEGDRADNGNLSLLLQMTRAENALFSQRIFCASTILFLTLFSTDGIL